MYPKVMNHPQYQPAVCVRVDGKGYALEGEPMHPKAAMFPPVTVYDAAQENAHRAMGYIEPGECAHAAEFAEYPKWVAGVLFDNADPQREAAALIAAPLRALFDGAEKDVTVARDEESSAQWLLQSEPENVRYKAEYEAAVMGRIAAEASMSAAESAWQRAFDEASHNPPSGHNVVEIRRRGRPRKAA